jgi:hypothetical protein
MLMFSLLVLLYSFKESLLLHLHICNCNAYLLLQDKKNKSAVGVNLTHFAQSIWMLKNCPKGWCPFYLEDFFLCSSLLLLMWLRNWRTGGEKLKGEGIEERKMTPFAKKLVRRRKRKEEASK